MNQVSGSVQIPLVGLSIGDGIMDPQTQTQGIADQAYMFGMFDYNEKQIGLAYEAAIGTFLSLQILLDIYLTQFLFSQNKIL